MSASLPPVDKPPEDAHEKGISGDSPKSSDKLDAASHEPIAAPPDAPSVVPTAVPQEKTDSPNAVLENINPGNPRILPASAGWQWIVMGWALYRKGPLFWLLLVLLTVSCVVLLGAVPIIGAVVAFILLPGFGAGFAAAGAWLTAFDVETARRSGFKRGLPGGKPITPLILFEGFIRNRKQQLLLGVYYVVALVVGVALSMLMDGGSFARNFGKPPTAEALRGSQYTLAMMVALASYAVVSGVFWFAPALIAFARPEDNMTATKALFFSFFAFWRNLRAFLAYAICWGVIMLVIGALITFAASLVSSAPLLLARGMMLPVGIMVMAVMYCTFYASYVTVYAPRVP
jgi:hypothetical protein